MTEQSEYYWERWQGSLLPAFAIRAAVMYARSLGVDESVFSILDKKYKAGKAGKVVSIDDLVNFFRMNTQLHERELNEMRKKIYYSSAIPPPERAARKREELDTHLKAAAALIATLSVGEQSSANDYAARFFSGNGDQ